MSTKRKAKDGKSGDQSVEQEQIVAASNATNTSKVKDGKSKAWLHFEKISNPSGEQVAKCNYCEKEISYISSWGTSNMWKHIAKCPKYPVNLDKKQKLLTTYEFEENGKVKRALGTWANLDKKQKLLTTYEFEENGKVKRALGTWKFDQDYGRHMLCRFVMANEQAFLLVENKEFREFVSAIQPDFKHVSCFTIARDCQKLYVSYKAKLRKTLVSLNSRIALTTDVWTSMQNLNYLCLSAHFIDEDWRLHKRVLNFVVMPSHKGKEIGKTVKCCINKWGIENKIVTLTMDNASSNDVAIGYLKERLNANKSLILNGAFFHMRCTAHILNLIVKDGLKETNSPIERIRQAIKYVRSSPTRAQLFQKCIEDEKLPHKGSVCLDIAIRWNSTYIMLQTALKFRQAFERLEDEDSYFAFELSYDTPTSVDWEIASAMSTFLEEFYEATKRMSGTLYVTSNKYFQEVMGILNSLTEWASGSDPTIKSMALKMKDKFDQYYGRIDKTNLMVLLSVVLDPTCKLGFFKFYFKKIYGDDDLESKELVDSVKVVVHRLYEEYEKELTNNSSSSTQASSSSILMETSQQKSKKVKFYNEFRQFQDADEGANEEKNELEKYPSERAEPYEIDFDVMAWWGKNESKYKVLAKMARDILAIPVSTVASESTFSTSGRVLDQFQSSLSPKVVEALVCG